MAMDPSFLQILWFVLIAVLWTGYLFLEGFDFGVGMLLPFVGRNNKERRVAINTIGPVWDGNEVWLLTAGGATFAAFPEWYATLFSGFYLPLLLILLALIVRAVAFEYRGKVNSETWRKRWDWCIIIGSWVPAVLWGVAFGNIVRGVQLTFDANMNSQYTGGFFALLNPFSLLGGAVTALIFLMHGSIFLSMKTDGEIRTRAGKMAIPLSIATTVVAAVWVLWLQLSYSHNSWTWAALIVAALALVGVILTLMAGRQKIAFILSGVAIVGAVALIFGALYPYVMPSTGDPSAALTAGTLAVEGGANPTTVSASSTQYTLTIMSWVAIVLTPVVLAYQAWTYWVFRKRISVDDIPDDAELPAAATS